MVTHGLPYPPHSGARSRDFHLIREVARRHSVVLLSQLESREEQAGVSALRVICEGVEAITPRDRTLAERLSGGARWVAGGHPLATFPFIEAEVGSALRRILATQPVDIVQIEHSFLAPYRDAIPPGAGCRTVLSLHNIGVDQYRSMVRMRAGSRRLGFVLKWLLMRGWEARVAARFDHTIVVSELDRTRLLSQAPGLAVSTIANGVATQDCPVLDEVGGATLLFVGTMGYHPNVEAACYCSETILPLIRREVPATRLLLAGAHPTRRVERLADLPGVTVTGYLPEVADAYRQAQVCVVPLRAGGGTRLKVLEAMAFGRPVVSTRVGCEGLDAVDGEHLLIADAPADFARQVVRLLTDPALRERLRWNARRLVEMRYDWSIVGQLLSALYERLAVTTST
jgi:glycosyltransferase involved in cell wall biosynthesis